MNKSFDKLINEIASKRPIQKRGENPILFFDDHAVMLQAGEMSGIHWVDIVIQMPKYRVSSLHSATKLLQANCEMAAATPIPTWFALSEKQETLFINRLDWQELSAEVLDDHIAGCIEQMNNALQNM